ncbi:MAG TPA: ROK family protein [Bacillaceae bacterium]|nr:ROK family protein [Bacillaceae bacterium]
MQTNLHNRKNVILEQIRTTLIELGSATKVELNELLDISFPTISKFLTLMEKKGEIISLGLDESSGGRRAKRYRYNPEYSLGLAIFLEKTETNYSIFNSIGEVRETGEICSVLTHNGLKVLTMNMENMIKKYPKIKTIAIGVPGSVENGKVFYIPGYDEFQHLDLKKYYENHFSIPVVIENDMNAAVIGYHANNELNAGKSLVYLYSGQNGPGAGILINGEVIRGSTFFSGEVSFIPQYNHKNFEQALGSKKITIQEDHEIDAISRLIATFTAIINPHTIIFSTDEVEKEILYKIANQSAIYIPVEHLPELTTSNWKNDYLYGLQNLALHLLRSQAID